MMLHFNRLQEEKDYERKISENLRQSRREATFELGNEVIMLSTKAKSDDNNMNDVPRELLDAESKLSILTTELVETQRRLMRAQAERENIQATKMLQHSKIGFQNNSKNAKNELTEFTLQSEREVQRM